MSAEWADFAETATSQWAEVGIEFNTVAFRTGIRLERLARRHENMLNDALLPFRSVGIRGMEDFRLLALLTRTNPKTTSSTAASKLLGLSKAATSARLDRFMKEDLAERAKVQYDNRTIEVVVSETGLVVGQECVAAVAIAHERLLSILPENKLNQLDLLLGDLTKHFV